MIAILTLCVLFVMVVGCWAALRRTRHLRGLAVADLLADTATRLSVQPAALAACLGSNSAVIESWMRVGVPAAAQSEICALARSAAALCGRMPPSRALRLLELRRRAADVSTGQALHLFDPAAESRRTIAGVVVTSR